jgi:hypothetical protein
MLLVSWKTRLGRIEAARGRQAVHRAGPLILLDGETADEAEARADRDGVRHNGVVLPRAFEQTAEGLAAWLQLYGGPRDPP